MRVCPYSKIVGESACGEYFCHVLSGIEALALAGFGPSWLCLPIQAIPTCLINMAGNCFSAFSITPILAAAVPLLGNTLDDFPADALESAMKQSEKCTEEQNQALEVSDSDSQ